MDDMSLQLRKFVAPEYVFGIGAAELAGQSVRNLGGRRALVVLDDGVLAHGLHRLVMESLAKEGVETVLFSAISSNPKESEIMAGAESYLKHGCDCLVAVGGGSPMDCAKGIGIVSSNDDHILSFEGVDNVPRPGPPLICIPTTSGTGAEVSQFAIVNDTRRRVKIAIVSRTLVPDLALLDPGHDLPELPDRLLESQFGDLVLVLPFSHRNHPLSIILYQSLSPGSRSDARRPIR